MTTSEATPSDSPTEIEGLSYGQALDELEALLDELESSDVDVDRLTEQVARGVQLVRFCRHRLEEVTDEVDGVVADLLSAPDVDPGEDSDGDTSDDGDEGGGGEAVGE